MVRTNKRKAEPGEGGPNIKKTTLVENDVVDVVQDDDIIYLNVGGKSMACSRSTLCQVKGSFLASMFSGRWEHGQKKDKDGNVFLNFDPRYFEIILQFLRAREIAIPEYPPPVPGLVPIRDGLPHLYSLVNYLGLNEAFNVCNDTCRFADEGSSHVSLSEGDRIAKHVDCCTNTEKERCTDTIRDFVCGVTFCRSGRTQWRLKVISMEAKSIFIGVLESNGDQITDANYPVYYDEGASGWNGEDIWRNGDFDYDTSADIVRVGVTYVLTLDLNEMTLSLSNGKDTTKMKLTSVKDKTESHSYFWSLCIGFNGTQNEVQLLD